MPHNSFYHNSWVKEKILVAQETLRNISVKFQLVENYFPQTPFLKLYCARTIRKELKYREEKLTMKKKS